MRGRLMVGHKTLNLGIGVRIPAPQQKGSVAFRAPKLVCFWLSSGLNCLFHSKSGIFLVYYRTWVEDIIVPPVGVTRQSKKGKEEGQKEDDVKTVASGLA